MVWICAKVWMVKPMSLLKIIEGDALKLLTVIPSKSIDLIIADPPYNLGKDYGNNHDNKDFEPYLFFTRKWTSEAKRVLKNSGTIYVFMGFQFISYLYQIMHSNLALNFNNWLCWHYTQGMGRKIGFSPRHDDILMFTKTKNYTYNLDAIRVPQKYYRQRNNMRGANPGDVWEFSHVHYSHPNRQQHPTQKPEALMERMVLGSSNEGDSVLDPFCGSGTTLRVCQQLERNCIGYDLNPSYVKMAEKRLEQPFEGFDSIDLRMGRVPLDLRNKTIRVEYLKCHLSWFLKHHNNALDKFRKTVKEMYGDDIMNSLEEKEQTEQSGQLDIEF